MVDNVSDFKMPEKLVTRLLKDALPDNVAINNDAKNAACRSASIFILQLSIGAAEKAAENKRRHLDNKDIIEAVIDLGLGEYASQLVRFGAQRKRNAKRKETSSIKSKSSKKTSDQPMEEQYDTPDPTDQEHDQDMPSQEETNDESLAIED